MDGDRLGPVLSTQAVRLLRALRDGEPKDPDPILRRDETLGCEEYVTLCYELHHVVLPELADNGLVEFDRLEDEVVRGPKFDEMVPFLEQSDSGQETTSGTWAGELQT